MPYVDPQSVSNPTTGQPILAAWGDAVRDGLEYMARNRPRCRVYRGSNQTLTTAVAAAITFNLERNDTGGMHSTVTNTSRITVPSGEDGYYDIGASIRFASNSTGSRRADLTVNGSTVIAQAIVPPVNGDVTVLNLSTIYPLVATDYIEIICTQTSGGNLDVVASGNSSPEMWAMWMAI